MTEEKNDEQKEPIVGDDKKNIKDRKEAKKEKKREEKKEKKKTWEEKSVEFEHKYKMALADYQNLLKRTANEKQEFAKYANEQVIIEMLPVYDNLKVSMEHIDEAAKTSGWAEGIKYVIKQFSDVLNGLGIEEIEATGKEFDPKTMDALEGEGEKVKKTVKAGYKLRDKVIMPAKVVLE